jgi:hypothetical protein
MPFLLGFQRQQGRRWQLGQQKQLREREWKQCSNSVIGSSHIAATIPNFVSH